MRRGLNRAVRPSQRGSNRANPLLAFESSRAKCTTEERSSSSSSPSRSSPVRTSADARQRLAERAARTCRSLRLEDELIGHFRQLAELGLLFVDAHAGNVLVRPATYTRHHLRSGYMVGRMGRDPSWMESAAMGACGVERGRAADRLRSRARADSDRPEHRLPDAADAHADGAHDCALRARATGRLPERDPAAGGASDGVGGWMRECAGVQPDRGPSATPRRRHDTRAASNQLQRFVFHAFAISQSLSKDPADVSVELGRNPRPPMGCGEGWSRRWPYCRWRAPARRRESDVPGVAVAVEQWAAAAVE